MAQGPPRRSASARVVAEAKPRRGRKKGTPNRFTAFGKALLEDTLWRLGGAVWLEQAARENPAAFMSLLGKLLPKQLELQPEGAAPLRIVVVTGVPKGAEMLTPTRGTLMGDPTERRAGAS
jgi:hypothetical protein